MVKRTTKTAKKEVSVTEPVAVISEEIKQEIVEQVKEEVVEEVKDVVVEEVKKEMKEAAKDELQREDNSEFISPIEEKEEDKVEEKSEEPETKMHIHEMGEDREERKHEEPVMPVSHEQEAKNKQSVGDIFDKDMTFGYPDVEEKEDANGDRTMILWAIGIIVAILVIGGGLILAKQRGIGGISMTPSPTPTIAAATSTPTPTLSVSKKDIKIEVQNGSGEAGVGAKMKALLEEKGYVVSGTKNADNYDYENTEVEVKAANLGYKDLIAKDIGGSYTVGTSTTVVNDSADYDVRVIVGKK